MLSSKAARLLELASANSRQSNRDAWLNTCKPSIQPPVRTTTNQLRTTYQYRGNKPDGSCWMAGRDCGSLTSLSGYRLCLEPSLAKRRSCSKCLSKLMRWWKSPHDLCTLKWLFCRMLPFSVYCRGI